MRLSTRLLILFIVIALVFGAFFYMFYYIKQEEMRLYRESDLSQRKETIEAVLRAHESSQKEFTNYHARRSQLRSFIYSAGTDMSESPISDAGESFAYSLFQVYDHAGRKLYSYTQEYAPGFAEYDLSQNVLESLAEKETLDYHAIFNQDILYCTTSVITSGYGRNIGYLLTANKLDNNYAKMLADELRHQVRISAEPIDCDHQQDYHHSCINIPLKDSSGKSIAWMSFSSSNPFLRKLKNLAILIIFGTMGFVFVFLLMQFFLIQQWISTPLTYISQSLRQSDPAIISKLTHSKNEFGDIANLIESFFVQKDELVWEIEERLKTEKKLREMEEQTRKILTTSPESIVVTNPIGNIITVNEEALRLMNWESEEELVLGEASYNQNVYPPDIALYDKFLEQLNLHGIVRNWEIRLQREDGSHFPALISASIVYEKEGQPSKLIFIARDVSERKELEARLRQSQKMESIGTLAGGIAHDFNNIITIIAGYITLSLGKPGESTAVQNNLNEALKACLRAKNIISKILTFSHQSELNISPINCAELVKETIPMIQTLLPGKIDIKSEISSDRYALADSTDLQQVILNLATNASHAMLPEGGTLYISLQEVEGFELIGMRHDIDYERLYLNLTVSDEGCGISPEDQSRIFDPYFSTKETGEGTGLGLSIVHGIITGYHGIISVQSKLGEGTTFNIYLPALDDVKMPQPKPKDQEIGFVPARIMLVDDEPALTEIFCDALLEAGYEVRCFTDSTIAMEHFAINNAEYELVIADINMPGLDGIHLATGIKAMKNIPVLLYTGFLDEKMRDRIKSTGIAYTLTKPVLPDEMVAQVRKMLWEYR